MEEDVSQKRLCRTCGEPGEFYLRSESGKPHRECKKCFLARNERRRKHLHETSPEFRARQAAKGSRWIKDNPERWRDTVLRREYGISLDEYNEMLARQGGVCAICGRPETAKKKTGEPKPLSVDHNHTTKRVRGLLCGNCNRAIGLLDDSPVLAASAARYLG